MQNVVYTRKISPHDLKESIEKIGFDKFYIDKAIEKYTFSLFKINNLSCPQASIIKQLALSIGADAAVHKEVITCKTEKSDVIIGATDSQIKILAQKLGHQPFKLSKIGIQLLEQIKTPLLPLTVRDTKFNWGEKSYLMGILNITPDSFSDGGNFYNLETAIKHAQKLIENGADIIDIGGESTRPDAQVVPPQEEQQRIIPIIKEIRKLNQYIPISIDTRNASTAQAAIESGADIINDVSGFDYDKKMCSIVAALNVPVILMHSLDIPSEMQKNPVYKNGVVDEIYFSLMKKIESAIGAGIKKENIIIDPGIGFGKTLENNLEIIKKTEEFKSLGCALLVGVSRKSVVANILNLPPDQREEANISLGSYLCANGADILRVHDVEKHYKALKVLDAVIR